MMGTADLPPERKQFHLTGTNPQHIATGDFNGDNKLDLVVVNQGSGNVSILLGNGDGTFGAAMPFPAGTNPRWVIVADFNGDNKLDLAVVDSGTSTGSGVSILIGTGTGSFGGPTFFAAGGVSLSAAVADFNGDQKLDLVVANSGSDSYSILIGNGDGSFQPAANHTLDLPGISVSPTSVVAINLNFDSFTDIAFVTPSTRDITLLNGNGDGTFQTAVHMTLDDPNFVNNRSTLYAANFTGFDAPSLILANLSAAHVSVSFTSRLQSELFADRAVMWRAYPRSAIAVV